MRILKLIAGVIALITALGGYMSFRYSTTSACEAAQKGIRDDMPKIIDDLAERDARFRALKVGGALFGGVDTLARGVTAELAADQVADKSALECAYLVGQRELDSAGFRKTVGDALADDLARRLSFSR